ncbi:uncharacterized protein LOC128268781 [Anopheles cruzii]|uniref:uncharacterized protein LOC128268781 n=1 Tax=Anopheles cruzii TaxID=68878 RepID=UPI0022EC2ED9|nr:uncharacterized protein LOC128268781 [Anopheles cruzii]
MSWACGWKSSAMGSPEPVTPIVQLPIEMLCTIFDYLDLESVKNASLACKRFKQVIFSDYYIKRFGLRITLGRKLNPAVASATFDERDRPVTRPFALGTGRNLSECDRDEMTQLLTQSERRYRNVTLDFEYCNESRSSISLLYQMLCPHRWEQELVELRLLITHWADMMVVLVVQTIPHMKRLRSLYVCADTEVNPARFAVGSLHLQNDTVTHLQLKALLPVTFSLPALRSFDVMFHPIQLMQVLFFQEQFYHKGFEHLKELTITSSAGDNSLHRLLTSDSVCRPAFKKRFFQKLTCLEKLQLLEKSTPESIFITICQSCSALRELRIRRLHILDSVALCHLSNLRHLQRLTIHAVAWRSPISFAECHLPRLERLQLDFASIQYSTLTFCPAVTKLSIHVNAQCFKDLIRTISVHMQRLTELSVFTCDELFLNGLISLLPRLRHLRVFEFQGGIFPKGWLKPIIANPMPELYKLAFRRSTFESLPSVKHPELRAAFPNLQLLDISECNPPLLMDAQNAVLAVCYRM